mmetsp:Transcript_21808/g.55344  ORF Transcript_21808/g.55344 Transcript_21808/m.55344 type:complete len:104 (-) Transcript_21808:222-533(-)
MVSSRWVVAPLGGGWVVCVAPSDEGFTQVSFVNTIATTNGGKHVDHVTEQLVAKLMDVHKKKGKSAPNQGAPDYLHQRPGPDHQPRNGPRIGCAAVAHCMLLF